MTMRGVALDGGDKGRKLDLPPPAVEVIAPGELSEVADRCLWKEKSSKILLIFISLIKKLNWLHSFNLCVKTEKDRSS